ncbi:hypothetical protein C7N43_15585 [Sphingobacteriales bacterium UPWRP_1]|nr:hypothetical protein C7N43_15585 [Sphingobacteriales bacterium UPWRP_1]
MNKNFTQPLFFAFFIALFSVFAASDTQAQCSINANPGAVSLGSITPSATWQTTGCITGGDYYTFTAVAGQQYNFTFCSNGGTAGWDTEISINNASNAGVAGAYNDDFCGIASQLNWTATAAGTFAVYVTGFGCTNNANCATLAYQTVVPPPPPTNLDVQTGGNNSSASWLVQNVFLTGCSQVSGVTFTGNGQGIGYFTNGASIGIQEGIIIASGAVTNAEGPNNQSGVTSSFGTPGDANLTGLTSFNPCGPASATFDAAVLQFTFVPLTSSVQFQYVFASDEYDEWVCSSFNDVFGFFISGPGIAGQQNIALVPGAGNTYVGINTVNLTNNSAYYNQNPAGSIITQYDGYTDVMTAIATGLTPCQTYTIKLAVADAGDSVLDSAVFLAANSFNAGNAVSVSSFVPSSGTQDAYEGCQDGYFQFTRGDITDLSAPIILNLTITGTATAGADYQTLPLTITIPAGQISYQLPVIAYADLLPEGFESIIVQVNELQCNCTFPPPAQLNIYDSPTPFTAFISNPPTICPGEQALIAVIASGSTFTPYNYVWSNGVSGPAIFVSPTVTTSYAVTVTDACGRTTGTSIQVNVSNAPPNATITPAGPFCSNAAPVTLTAASGGGTWSGPGVNPTTGLFDPAAAAASGAGPYTISYSVSNSCGSSTNSTQIVVNPVAVPVINAVTPACQGAGGTITLTANVAGGTWSGPGILGGTNTSGQFSYSLAASSGAGPYTITYTTPAPCGSSDTETITVLPPAAASIAPVPPICNGQSASLTASGGGTYLWSNGATSPSISVSPTANTTYNVTVTNAGGCTATASASVTVNNITAPTIPAAVICPGQNTTLNAGPGYTNYQWSTGATGQSITVNPSVNTTYTVTVTNAAGCTTTASADITIGSNIIPPNMIPQTLCSGGSVTLNAGSGYSTYAWSGGAGSTQSVTVSPTATTTYTVTVSNAQGCTTTGSVTITVNTISAATIPPAQACVGNAATLVVSGGPYTGFAWSTGATGPSITVSPTSTTTYTVTATNAAGCSTTASGTVTINSASPPTINSPSICAGASATLTATPASSSYQWSTGATGPSITVTPGSSATYTLTITNAQGCTASASASVTVNNNPTASIGGSTSFCIGSSTTLSAQPTGAGTTYLWSGGLGTGQSINVSTPGTYTVTVTDGSGCQGTAQVNVTQNTSLSPVISGDTQLCAGETSVLDAGSGFAFYSWGGLGSGNTQTITASAPGAYTVAVTDASGCTGTTTTTININPAPVVAITGDPTVCNGDDSFLSATAGFTQYEWSTGQFGAGITVTAAGTYTVTVTDANNCTAQQSYVITENNIAPPPIAPASTCAGVPIPNPLDAGPGYASYAWSTGATTQTITTTPLTTTNYTVTVTNAEGCSAVNTGTVNVIAQPTAVADPPINMCIGDVVLLGVTGNGDTFQWSNGDNSGPIIGVSPASTTTYTVTVSIGSACSATASQTVFVNPLPTPSVTGDDVICAGEQTTLTASGGFIYSWTGFTGNLSSITVSPAATTTYTVTATDLNGCTGTASTTVTVNALTGLAINGAQPVCEGSSVTLTATGGQTYQWSTGVSGDNITVSPLASTTYTVAATDANGCTAEQSVTIDVNNTPIAIPNGNTPCSGQDLQLSGDVFVPGGLPGGSTIDYSWSGPLGFSSTDQFPVIAGATTQEADTYTLVVTVNGCPSAPVTYDVTVLQGPNAIVSNNGPACAGDVQLFGDADIVGSVVSYEWTGPGGYTSTLQNPILSGSSAQSGTYSLVVTVDGCPSPAQPTDVSIFPVPPVTISGNPVFCAGSSTSITVDESYTSYAWSNGTTTQNNTVTAGGIYTVTVTDANNCTNTQFINIVENPLPTPTITGDDEICAGNITTLNATSGFASYAWSDGQSTKNVDVAPNVTTTYIVTVTDDNGCTGTASHTVATIPSPDITITGPSGVCLGFSATLTAQGDPTYTYQWSNGANTQTVTLTPPTTTTYTVTATNNIGCTRTASITVPVNFTLDPTIVGPTVICPGATATLNPGSYDEYEWSNGATTQTISVSPTGPTTYSVTVSDTNGCTGSGSTSIQLYVPPTVSITDSIGCGNFAQIAATPNFAAYIWNNSATTDTIYPTIAGTYYVTITDGNGCTASSNGVDIDFQPDPTLAVISTTNATCGNANGSISVSGSGGTAPLTYSWSQNAGLNNSTAGNLAAGPYSVTVTDDNGCTATTNSTVTNIAGPTITAMTPTDGSCGNANGSIAVTATGGTAPVNYTWSQNALLNNPNATGLAANSYSVTVTDANNCTVTQSAVVGNLAGPTLSTGAITDAECGIANGAASVIVSGGTAPITYTWSQNALLNSPNATGLLAGSYTVTATDANGCQAIQPLAVANQGAPTLTVTNPVNTTCGNANGSITVTASGGTGALTYAWSHDPALTVNTATGLAAGNYFVTVYDSNNCQAVQSIILTNAAGPTLQVTGVTPDFCNSGVGSVTVTANGGTGALTYAWSHNASLNSPNATGLDANTYTVTVTDTNGCSATISAPVAATPNPTLSVTAENPASCGQANGSGAVSATDGTAPYTYAWEQDPLLNVNAASNLATGSYDVTVTDTNGCTATTTVNISTLDAATINLISTSNAICGQDNGSIAVSTTGGNGAITYSWSHAPLLDSSTATGLAAGSYTVSATDATGCVSTLDVSISADPVPGISVSGVNNTTCGGNNGSILVSASGGTGTLTYSWSHDPALNSDNATGLAASSYSVTVTDGNGCSASVTATVNASASPVLSVANTTNATCGNSNGSITFSTAGGTGALTYAWSQDNTLNSPTATGLADGTYTVTVTDANGCSDTESATITNGNAPTVSVGSVTNATCGNNTGSVTFSASGGTGALTYAWSQDNALNNPTATNLSSGTYTVTVTDASGCTGTASATVTDSNAPTVSVNNTTDASCGNSNGSITFSAAGGTGALTYTWSQAGISGPSGTNLSDGTYTVTVTDASGCTGTANATIGNSTPPSVSEDVITPASCGQTDGAASVIASGGTGAITYEWSQDAALNSPNAPNLGVGSYTVTVTDALGCTDEVTLAVNSLDGPQLSLVSNTPATCGNNNGSVEVLVSGGTGTISYTWSHDGTLNSNIASGLSGGSYSVTVADANNCPNVLSVTVDSFASPAATMSATATACGLDEGTAAITVTGGTAPLSYTWSHDATLNAPDATNLAPGDYLVTITDANNCTATAQATVDGSMLPPAPLCGTATNSSVAFVWDPVPGATGYEIVIDGGAPQTLPAGTTSYDVTGLAQNTTVTITVTAVGPAECGNSITVSQDCTSLDIACPPITPEINGLAAGYCIDETAVTLTGTPAGGTFSGSSISGNSFDPATAGTGVHTITYDYTNPDGCFYTTTLDVEVVEVPVALFTAPDVVCLGEQATYSFTGTAAASSIYSWNFASAGSQTGAGPHNIAWNSPGTYTATLTVSTPEGCTDNFSQEIGVSNVNVTATTPQGFINSGASANLTATATSALNGALTYTWTASSGELSCNDCPDPVATPVDDLTTYTITVLDEFGCEASASLQIGLIYQKLVTIPNAFSPNGDGENDVFRLSGFNVETVNLYIYDRWGGQKFEAINVTIDQGWDGTFKGKNAELGVYVYYAEVTFTDGTTDFFKGNVTLIR